MWLGAVFSATVEQVGIVLTLLALVEKIPRVRHFLSEKPILDRFVPLIWVVAISCMLYGFFIVWRNQYEAAQTAERRRAEAEDRSKPKFLTDKLDQWAIGDMPGDSNSTSLVIWMHIANDGAPSIINRFELTVELPDGRKIIGERFYGKKLIFPGKGELDEQDCLFNKNASTPLTTGALVQGWIFFKLPGVTRDEVNKPTSLMTVSFGDITGTIYAVNQTVRGDESGRFNYFPGMTPPKPAEPKRWGGTN